MWFTSSQRRSRTRLSRTTCQTPRPRRGSHIKRKSRHDALTRRAVYGRGGTSAPRAACREHRDATPRARTVASTDFVVKYISSYAIALSLGSLTIHIRAPSRSGGRQRRNHTRHARPPRRAKPDGHVPRLPYRVRGGRHRAPRPHGNRRVALDPHG